jgi:glycosyltransferase involved in cell wall biosynthesis
MLKNGGTVCSDGGFDCLDCKETLTEALAIPSPIRNAHILLSLRKVDRLIAPSEYLAAMYIANGIPRAQIAVIRNGIDLVNFQRSRQERDVLTLGFIGFLGKHKGLDVLLHALALLGDLDKVRLLIVGDGEEMDHLKALCLDLHLAHVVTFRGHVDHPSSATMYEQIDGLVVPSICPENCPSVIGEAMASGIPVIACANVRELRGLCVASNAGLFYENLNELQECLALLLSNEPIRQGMGRNGWNSVGSLQRATARSSKSGVCRLGSLWKRHNGRTGPSRSVAVDTEGERPCTSASG